MARQLPRVGVMLDLQWPYKRHSEIFAGLERYAEERGWVSIIDEFVHDTLRRRGGASERYDDIVARANHPLARRAARLGVPVVNVWPSSPARHLLPGCSLIRSKPAGWWPTTCWPAASAPSPPSPPRRTWTRQVDSASCKGTPGLTFDGFEMGG